MFKNKNIILLIILFTAVGSATVINVPSDYSTIQQAITAATNGDTIQIAAGTYAEQVTLTGTNRKSLTFIGAGPSTVIRPTSIPQLFPRYDGFSLNTAAIFVVDSVAGIGPVIIKNLKIDGSGITTMPAGATMLGGIQFRESGGKIENVTIEGFVISLSAFINAFYFSDVWEPASTVEIAHSKIKDYTKFGLVCNGAYASGNFHHDSIIGLGIVTYTYAGGGIQFGYGSTGIVAHNYIKDNVSCGASTWCACGVLGYQAANVSVTNNVFEGNESAIHFEYTSSANVLDNIIISPVKGPNTGWAGGIGMAAWSKGEGKRSLPSPFDKDVIMPSEDVYNYTVNQNSIIGDDEQDTEGIWVYNGGSHTFNVTANRNNLSDWDYGFSLYQTGVNVSGVYNNIVSNHYGVVKNNTPAADLQNCWWGHASGPYHATLNPTGQGDTVSDYVNFSNWLLTEYGQKTIIASAHGNGVITPSGTVIVEYGADTTFRITPNIGYKIDSVLVDGANQGALTQYTFENVIDNHTIDAYFSALTSGWIIKAAVNTNLTPSVDKVIKEGGALVGVDDEYLYAFIGTKTNVFRKYTIATNSWETRESLPFGIKYPNQEINKKYIGKGAALCYDGDSLIYATRGNGTWDFWVYNLNNTTWRRLKPVPSPKKLKIGTALAYSNGRVYILTGGHKPTDLTNFYAYDVANDTWIVREGLECTPTSKPLKAGTAMTALNGVIYAIKGGDKTNKFFEYAINGDSWITRPVIPEEDTVFGKYKKKVLVKDGACLAAGGDYVYAIKGNGTDVFWRYNPNTEVWQMLEPIPVSDKKHAPKTGAAMAYADGKIWLLVGNKQPDFWCYTIGGMKSPKSNTIPTATADKVHTKPMMSISPNPMFNKNYVAYEVPVSGRVKMILYNMTGQKEKVLVDEYLNSGCYTLELTNLARGVYFLKYEVNDTSVVAKVIVE